MNLSTIPPDQVWLNGCQNMQLHTLNSCYVKTTQAWYNKRVQTTKALLMSGGCTDGPPILFTSCVGVVRSNLRITIRLRKWFA